MQIVIPMSGAGSRFARRGYPLPKPLISVDGIPMIEHVVRMFPGESDFLFVCSRVHLEETPLRSVLHRIAPAGRVVAIEPHKRGPVHAVLQAAAHIQNREPVILNYCDFAVSWDYPDFRARVQQVGCAGALTVYKGFHPHSLGPNLYAYCRSRGPWLEEIGEKRCFTDNRLEEYASSGTYYFQSGELMKRCFEQAIASDLQTNGEFYASMPFNLLVQRGLPVYLYELEQFLQWGTPEDLEEYQSWSDYFAHAAHWRPRLPRQSGTTLLPMAGTGQRFQSAGYAQPKPLIPVAGVPMVARSIDSLPPTEQVIAVCRREHLAGGELADVLASGPVDPDLLPLDQNTNGQASTCLLAEPHVDPDAPLLIAPCDSASVFREERFLDLTENTDVDCLVWTFRNHPHANRNPQQYGWIQTGMVGEVEKVSCKQALRPDVREDDGIIGTFWFRRARLFFDAARALVASGRRVNGEFYADSVIQVLTEQGHRAHVLPVRHYLCFGTPDDVRTYEYWERYFRQAQRHPYGKEAARHAVVDRAALL